MTLNQEEAYKHAIFQIGETLVDVDKRHISAENACEKIRRCLQELDARSSKIKNCATCGYSESMMTYCYMKDMFKKHDELCADYIKNDI